MGGTHVSDRGPIQWEPQSVEGPKGFPTRGPLDGRLRAANHPAFAPLDDQSKPWPKTNVVAHGLRSFPP
ncbi:lytic polysaccharide monooxygenase [Amycolatopsis arida]|uniref:lytic polysaccharide monooxygenase n=1 Tax=Amycolatopsis arida TaxID=587909 RepID=UPI000AF7718A